METQSELIDRKIAATRAGAIAYVEERLREELEARVITLVGGDHDGAKVVSEEDVRRAAFAAFHAILPPTDVRTAEVVTPAVVFVDVVCPRCKEAARVTAAITAELRVSTSESELHIKAKASKAAHTCGQLTVLEVPDEEKIDAEAEAAVDAAEDILEAAAEEEPPEKPKRTRKPKIEACPFPGCVLGAEHPGDHDAPKLRDDSLPPDVGDEGTSEP